MRVAVMSGGGNEMGVYVRVVVTNSSGVGW
jgi:hypothetical protein